MMSVNHSSEWPSVTKLESIFIDEITTAGDSVTGVIRTEEWTFLRSVSPVAAEVQPGDRVQGGVALRAADNELWLHPYVFRQICSNGAIFAQAVESHHLTDLDLQDRAEGEYRLREAIRACGSQQSFGETVAAMRSSLRETINEREAMEIASLLINFAQILGPGASPAVARLVGTIMEFTSGRRERRDRSRYALLNEVTATAREVKVPSVRWGLEELGGAIAMGCLPQEPRSPLRADAGQGLIAV